MSRDARSRLARLAGDLSGAFADLGTFLPLIVGVVSVGHLDPGPILIGFGIFSLAVAAIYQRPIPVQPMKAIAAITMTSAYDADTVMAAGIALGVLLTLLALTNAVNGLARMIPKSVLCGVQLGVGLQLAWMGVQLMSSDCLMAATALAMLLALRATPFNVVSCIAVLTTTGLYSAAHTAQPLPPLNLEVDLPGWHLPGWGSLRLALEHLVLPQLALTVINAVVITAAIASELFPHKAGRITPRQLALSSGVLNLILAPIGAFPMCHGAGGLIVQHRFGARTGCAPAVFGLFCVVTGVLFGSNADLLLSLVPPGSIGALLTIAGIGLAASKRLVDGHAGCLLVILVTATTCLAINVASGLIAGWCLERIRSHILRRLRTGRR